MGEDDAVEALERLGLSTYEAKVFIALQKLGTGTARDVARVTDVPRPQVYGTAERLEELGLVELQRSTPMQYRPVAVEEARSRLRESFESDQEAAFDYIDDVRSEFSDEDEEREDVWTVRDVSTVNERVARLVGTADESLLLGVHDDSLVDGAVADAVVERAQRGVDVTIVSADDAVHDRFAGADVAVRRPTSAQRVDRNGRVLVVDRDTVLLSVLGTGPDGLSETAIWSTDTGFASVLVELVEAWLRR